MDCRNISGAVLKDISKIIALYGFYLLLYSTISVPLIQKLVIEKQANYVVVFSLLFYMPFLLSIVYIIVKSCKISFFITESSNIKHEYIIVFFMLVSISMPFLAA